MLQVNVPNDCLSGRDVGYRVDLDGLVLNNSEAHAGFLPAPVYGAAREATGRRKAEYAGGG